MLFAKKIVIIKQIIHQRQQGRLLDLCLYSKRPTGTQLMSYTHKSKRLTGSIDKTSSNKNSSKSKKKLNNSTSCNLIGFYEKQPGYQGERKMSKYIQAKNPVRQNEPSNCTEEHCTTRRINTSMSNLSSHHRMPSSKSKSKRKKSKKPTHMKSHSNIPVYKDQQMSTRASAKKQFSDQKSKKKRYVRHAHHQSEANVSTSVSNKNNVLMIDSSIGEWVCNYSLGFKAFINL